MSVKSSHLRACIEQELKRQGGRERCIKVQENWSSSSHWFPSMYIALKLEIITMVVEPFNFFYVLYIFTCYVQLFHNNAIRTSPYVVPTPILTNLFGRKKEMVSSLSVMPIGLFNAVILTNMARALQIPIPFLFGKPFVFHKFKDFIWIACRNSIHTHLNLKMKHVEINGLCGFCNNHEKDLLQALFLCPIIRHYWYVYLSCMQEANHCKSFVELATWV